MATASTPVPAPRFTAANFVPEVGALLAERYRVLGPLGEGRMGKVYLVEHELLRKKLAIKLLDPALATSDLATRFEREAMAAANIAHPNVAKATDFGRLADGSLFLALEYVEGCTLRAELQRGPLGVARAIGIARQIGSALVAAHALGIVHRDLKPENVMLVARGEDRDLVKVLDFGIARFSDPTNRLAAGPITKPSTVFGTPEYMAPEQALGQPVDGRADLFSLGVILFEMVAGVRPYDAPSLGAVLGQQLAGPPPSLAAKRPALPALPQLEKLLEQLLARHAEQRPASAELVLHALESCLAEPATARADAVLPAPGGVQGGPPPQFPTFLPGDPLPAFALPADEPEAPTLFVAPRVSSAAPAAPLRPNAPKPALRIVAVLRARLPKRLAERLSRLTDQALLSLLAASALLVLGALALVVSSLRAGNARVAPPAMAGSAAPVATPSASGAQVAQAAPSADPNDASALLDAALASQRDGRVGEAVASVSRALSRRPSLRDDERVASVLYRSAAANDEKVVATTFSLLQGVMAGRGAEVQYRLALDKSVPERTRRAAERWLKSDELKRAASEDLHTAVRLRFASSCADRRTLLPFAGKAGKKLTLDVLREFSHERGCGFSGDEDCYACMRADTSLKDAVSAIEARLDG